MKKVEKHVTRGNTRIGTVDPCEYPCCTSYSVGVRSTELHCNVVIIRTLYLKHELGGVQS